MLVSLSISNVAALREEVSRIYPNIALTDMNDALARSLGFENAASMHAVLGNGDLSAFCDR